jgi:hypothetical protein
MRVNSYQCKNWLLELSIYIVTFSEGTIHINLPTKEKRKRYIAILFVSGLADDGNRKLFLLHKLGL